MSAPTDNTLIEGSVSIEDAGAPLQHGYGGLTVQHNLIVDSSSAVDNKIELTADDSSFFKVLATTTATSTLTLESAGTGANALDLNTTAGGITADAATSISLDAATDSNFTVTGSGQDLTLAALGGGAQQVLVQTAGTGSDALKLEALNGGIHVDANGGVGNSQISIQTDDTTGGILIGTATSGVPVMIGTGVKGTPGTSQTTVKGDLEIFGDLVVNGDTTTVNTETLTVEDPIFAVNFVDNGSGGLDVTTIDAGARMGFDSGMYHIRNKDDLCGHAGAKVDSGGALQAGSTATIPVLTSDPNTGPLDGTKYDTDDYLNTFVIKMTSGTSVGECRRIIDWNGTTHAATLNTAFTGVSATDTYELYAPAKAFIFDESEDEYALILTGSKHTDTTLEILDYCDLHVGTLIVDDDIVVPCFKTEDVALPADATTAVTITCTDTRGAFMLLVEGLSDTVAAGNDAATNGAAATFTISKRDSSLAGASVTRSTHSPGNVVGVNSEMLRVDWPAAGKIRLYHQSSPGGGGGETITYRVRVICI